MRRTWLVVALTTLLSGCSGGAIPKSARDLGVIDGRSSPLRVVDGPTPEYPSVWAAAGASAGTTVWSAYSVVMVSKRLMIDKATALVSPNYTDTDVLVGVRGVDGMTGGTFNEYPGATEVPAFTGKPRPIRHAVLEPDTPYVIYIRAKVDTPQDGYILGARLYSSALPDGSVKVLSPVLGCVCAPPPPTPDTPVGSTPWSGTCSPETVDAFRRSAIAVMGTEFRW